MTNSQSVEQDGIVAGNIFAMLDNANRGFLNILYWATDLVALIAYITYKKMASFVSPNCSWLLLERPVSTPLLYFYPRSLMITAGNKSYQTAVATMISWWFLSGMTSDSPTKKFDTMLVAKHISMLETQHANGCLRENATEPKTSHQSPSKTSSDIWVEDSMGPRNHVWGSRSHREKGQFWGRGKGQPIVKYRDAMLWAVQQVLSSVAEMGGRLATNRHGPKIVEGCCIDRGSTGSRGSNDPPLFRERCQPIGFNPPLFHA